MARSLVITVRDRRTERTRRFAFTTPRCTIGRAPTSDLVLAHPLVAPTHLAIELADGIAILADRRLRTGEQLEIADYALTIDLIGGTADDVKYLMTGDRDYVHDPAEAPFLDGLRANPTDAALREVYADWLEQHGYHHRAEYLRVDRENHGRLNVLSDSSDVEWRATVSRTPIEGCAWEVECPKQWSELAPTDVATVRDCSTCSRTVTFCSTLEEIRTHARAKACVAFDSKLFRHAATDAYADPDPRPIVMGRIAPR